MILELIRYQKLNLNSVTLFTAGHTISFPIISEKEAQNIQQQILLRLRVPMTMYSPQKLHPISYIDGLISVIKSNFIVIIIFLFNIKDFKYDDFSSYIIPGIMTLIFSIGFIHNIIKVYNTRYWIEEDHFILTTGVLIRNEKNLILVAYNLQIRLKV